MQRRTFVFNVGHESPEFIGRVWSEVTVMRDGEVFVTTSLIGPDDERRDRFDVPTGRIEPRLSQSGKTTSYQYVYPTGRSYPGISPTVREAAQRAAQHATAQFTKAIAGSDR